MEIVTDFYIINLRSSKIYVFDVDLLDKDIFYNPVLYVKNNMEIRNNNICIKSNNLGNVEDVNINMDDFSDDIFDVENVNMLTKIYLRMISENGRN